MSFETECAGKHKYASQSLVAIIVGHKQGAKLESYKCQHCAYFHVGDAPKSDRPAKRVEK